MLNEQAKQEMSAHLLPVLLAATEGRQDRE